jgi:integrase
VSRTLIVARAASGTASRLTRVWSVNPPQDGLDRRSVPPMSSVVVGTSPAFSLSAVSRSDRLVVPLACYCQLRRSEVLGLQRKHIDLEQSTLRVEQAWTVSGGAIHLGPPKTEAGRRDIPIPANVLPLLIDHLNRFVGQGVRAGSSLDTGARWSARARSTASGQSPGRQSVARISTQPTSTRPHCHKRGPPNGV